MIYSLTKNTRMQSSRSYYPYVYIYLYICIYYAHEPCAST